MVSCAGVCAIERVERVLAIGRNSTCLTHPKLREMVRKGYARLRRKGRGPRRVRRLLLLPGHFAGAGMSETDYTRPTFDLTNEQALRNLSRDVLEGLGYTVLMARNGGESEERAVYITREKSAHRSAALKSAEKES
jgi:hypothetical protein